MPSATGSAMLRLESKAVDGHRSPRRWRVPMASEPREASWTAPAPWRFSSVKPAGGTEKAARCRPRRNEVNAACRVEATCLVKVCLIFIHCSVQNREKLTSEKIMSIALWGFSLNDFIMSVMEKGFSVTQKVKSLTEKTKSLTEKVMSVMDIIMSAMEKGFSVPDFAFSAAKLPFP